MKTSVADPDSTFRYCGSDFFFKTCQRIKVFERTIHPSTSYHLDTTHLSKNFWKHVQFIFQIIILFVKHQHILSPGSSSRDQDNCKRKLHEKKYDEIKLNKFFFWKLMGHNLMIIIVLFVHFLYDQFHAHRCTFWTRERKQY